MNTVSQALLIGSNLVLAAAVSFHVLKSEPEKARSAAAISLTAGDLQPILRPIETLDQSVNRLNLTLQRFNTTFLQYEYLQKEIERLMRIDQSLAKRINFEQGKPAKERTAEFDNDLKQLRVLQQQVHKELKQRRDSTGRLIEGLERLLNEASPGKKAHEQVPANGNAADDAGEKN